jgi:hypothetical protein
MVAVSGGSVMAEMDISIKVDGQSMNALLKKLAEMPDRLERKIARQQNPTKAYATITPYRNLQRMVKTNGHESNKGFAEKVYHS